MSSKCPGCGYYTLACQCRKDDNYCRCDRVISDCHCDDHNDHWTYDNPSSDKYDNDDTCNGGKSDWDNWEDLGDWKPKIKIWINLN